MFQMIQVDKTIDLLNEQNAPPHSVEFLMLLAIKALLFESISEWEWSSCTHCYEFAQFICEKTCTTIGVNQKSGIHDLLPIYDQILCYQSCCDHLTALKAHGISFQCLDIRGHFLLHQ